MGEVDKVQGMLREILDGQKDQSDRLEAHGETLKEQGGAIEDINASVSDLKGQTDINFTRLATRFEGLEERAKEDRAEVTRKVDKLRDDVKDTEETLEGKVGQAHANNQATATEVGEIKGTVKNHMDDEHATIAMQTEKTIADHMIDDNRHAGEAPGGGKYVKTGAAVGGGTLAGGGIIWAILKAFDMFAGVS